jgi:hypothetical protein
MFLAFTRSCVSVFIYNALMIPASKKQWGRYFMFRSDFGFKVATVLKSYELSSL